VPWCEECAKFWTPTSLTAEGACPSCGRRVAVAEAPPKAPWHFKLLVAAVVFYLLWRVFQLLGWIF
jgi:uncharacterized paraquat-inducible protein A